MSIFFFLIIGFAVIFAMIVLLFSQKRGFSRKEKERIQKYWNKIKEEKDDKKAILEADKLLDHVLKKKGYTGTLGEKLKKASFLFRNKNSVWFAHKLRNKIAHEMDFFISNHDAQTARMAFYSALKDLDAF